MGKVKFTLKEPNSKKETLVYLVYNYQYKRFKYSTGEKINPIFWNLRNQRAKETKKFKEYPEFNTRLDTLQSALNTIFRRLLNDGIQPNNELLKKELENELDSKVLKKRKLTLFDFIENYIEESKNFKQKSTVTVYKTTQKHLKNFSEKTKNNVDFESINLTFYSSFMKYLSKDLEMSNNTVGKYIKTLKSFLNEATERGLNENLEFKKRKFKTLKEETDKVYLSNSELEIILNYNFANQEHLEKVRDLFLIGCYTGLRFSDFTQIKEENIFLDKSLIQINTKKTNERITIPMHKIVRDILKKYNYNLPKSYTNQKMNKYLKDIVEQCEINSLIEITTSNAGIIKKSSIPKYDLITTHTARRSFATNLYLADIPSISIMKITGHKTEKSFLRYIKVTQEQNANKLLTHSFFK